MLRDEIISGVPISTERWQGRFAGMGHLRAPRRARTTTTAACIPQCRWFAPRKGRDEEPLRISMPAERWRGSGGGAQRRVRPSRRVRPARGWLGRHRRPHRRGQDGLADLRQNHRGDRPPAARARTLSAPPAPVWRIFPTCTHIEQPTSARDCFSGRPESPEAMPKPEPVPTTKSEAHDRDDRPAEKIAGQKRPADLPDEPVGNPKRTAVTLDASEASPSPPSGCPVSPPFPTRPASEPRSASVRRPLRTSSSSASSPKRTPPPRPPPPAPRPPPPGSAPKPRPRAATSCPPGSPRSSTA